jgi:hypothetical protein
MGTIRIEGIPYAIQIEGDTPTKEEAQRIMKIVEALKATDNRYDDEAMRKVYETNDPDIIAAVEAAKRVHEKFQGRDILKEFGFDEGLPEGLDLVMDRDDAFIAGSVVGSIPGLKDMFKLKNIKNIPTNPKDLMRVFGKAWFGGIFGSVSASQAYDIAQYLITGKKDYLPTFEQMNQDTKEAIFWESIGLLVPEAIPKLARATLDFKDPAIIKARKVADALGIQLDIAAQSKIGQLILKPLGILPFIGGGLRNSKGKRVGQLNDIFNDVLLTITPTSKVGDQGISIFQAGKKKFKAMKETMGTLWQKAYDSHAMLPDANILNTTMKGGIKEVLENFTKGNILREFSNVPVDKNGIILSFDDIVKSGFLRDLNLERIADDKPLRDFFNWMRSTQKTIADQGGDISYKQLRAWNGNLQSFFNDIVGNGKYMNKEMTKLLTQLKKGLDMSILPDAINIMKIGDEDLANLIVQSHKDANTFTKNFKTLFTSPAANKFNAFVKNIFGVGYDSTKKDIDQMLEAVLKIKSPTTLQQLKEIVGPAVFKEIAKRHVDNAMRASMGSFDVGLLGIADTVGKKGGKKVMQFDPGTLAQKLGFDATNPSEHGLMLLKEAGIDPTFMKNIIDMGVFESGIKIGDPSTYLMRSAQIKGMQPFLQGLFRTGGGSAAAAAGGALGMGAALQGLFAMMIGRYGLTKFLGNPTLAKAANTIFDPARQASFTNVPFTKIPLGPRFWQRAIQDVFDLHLKENPEERDGDIEFLKEFKNNLSPDSVEFRMFESILEDLGIGEMKPIGLPDVDPNIINQQNLELQNQILGGGNEEIIEDETSFLEVPQINNNFDTQQVIEPIPLPEVASAPMSDPNTMTKLENVGLPLFANQGGIASLIGNKKPQQMVS